MILRCRHPGDFWFMAPSARVSVSEQGDKELSFIPRNHFCAVATIASSDENEQPGGCKGTTCTYPRRQNLGPIGSIRN